MKRPLRASGTTVDSMITVRQLRPFLVCAIFLSSLVTGNADEVSDLVEKGGALDRKLQPAQALKFYLPAEKLAPKDHDLQLRIARQYRHLMSKTSDKKEKLRLGKTSLEHAENAAALAPKNAEAQLSPAISYGKMMPYMGSGDQAAASPKIKASVDRALRLDPKNDTAWHILGRWNRTLASIGGVKRALAGAVYGGLPTGSIEAAEDSLKKALVINPNRLMHYIELGRVYAQVGLDDAARRMLQKGLAMPNREIDDPEMKQIGRETLSKLK